MNIGMRAKQIEVPEKDPFKNDLFDRQGPADDLTNLVRNIDAPAVIAIDGAWGTGKTTFLNLWVQSLLDGGQPVVHFNAWENDYSANALVSILSELTMQLSDIDENFGLKDLLTDATIKIFSEIANNSLKIASSGMFGLDSLKSQNGILAEHKAYKQQLEKFRKNLSQLASKYRKEKEFPLVIIIDELDRCRPTFAIDVLELAKHLFSISDVVFVLAFNRRELSHSIKSIYGERFDSLGYLERFVEITFRLPLSDRKNFLLSELSSKCGHRYHSDGDFRYAIDVLFTIFSLPNFNLRTASHYIRRLDYVLASIGYEKNYYFMNSLVVALITRSINRESYLLFYDSQISDEEFADSIFEQEGLQNIRHDSAGAMIEAIIIAAQLEKERIRLNNDSADVAHTSSLLNKYKAIINNPILEDTDKQHANEVIRLHEQDNKPSHYFPFPTFGKHYLRAVNLIEMISPKS